jgi:hypothetical protein
MTMLRKCATVAAGILLALATPAAAFAGSGASASASPMFVRPGNFTTFRIHCGGNPKSASLNGTLIGGPSHIMMHRNGGGNFSLRLRIPFDTRPGTYHVSMQCSNGDFDSARLCVSPHGGADTGDGATSDDATRLMTTVGGGALGVAAVGGGFLLYRRRRPA